MSNKFIKIFGLTTLFFVLFLIVFPSLVFSQATYTPLETIPQLTDGGNTVSIATYIPNLVKLIIQIAGALAVIMIVIGGVQYATTDAIQGKSEGKERIKDAIYGLLLAIGAFIILNTISPGLLELNLDIRPITTEVSPSTPGSGTNTPPTSGSWIGRPWPSSWPSGTPSPSDTSARATLRNFPVVVTVNKSNCAKIGDSNCTSLDGLSQSAISGLQRLSILAQAWGGIGSITVNGGTEYWSHNLRITDLEKRADPNINRSAHKPGQGAVDIARNSQIDALIQSHPRETNQTCYANKPAYRIGNAIYTQEDAVHWHVCY